MIPKSGHRFSEKIMLNEKLDDDSKKSHHALRASASAPAVASAGPERGRVEEIYFAGFRGLASATGATGSGMRRRPSDGGSGACGCARSRATASPRRRAWSFPRMLWIWFLTVASLIRSERPTSLFDIPSPTRAKNLPLALGQLLRIRRPAEPGRQGAHAPEQQMGDARRTVEFAAQREFDRIDQIFLGAVGGDIPGDPRLGTGENDLIDFADRERHHLGVGEPRAQGPRRGKTLARTDIEDDDVRVQRNQTAQRPRREIVGADHFEGLLPGDAPQQPFAVQPDIAQDEDASEPPDLPRMVS